MNTSIRLQPAVEMAKQHAEDAARSLARCQQEIRDRQLQLDELVGYRVDYTKGLLQKSCNGLNAARMNDYSLFLERLNKAIEQLQISLDSAYKELSASKRVLLEKFQRTKALENVVSRHQQGERRVQSRREQNESDEHAQRVARPVFR